MRHQFQPQPRSHATAVNRKRYGWWRCYNDFVGHPKWRLVAARSGVHLAFTTLIVQALCQVASKARRRGYIGDAEFDIIAVMTDIPTEQVAAVFKTLCDLGWIEQDHIIDWPDRQPDAEDPTAAERQRQKRARDRAKRAIAMGTAKPEDRELVQAVEREREQASRVTTPSTPPTSETIQPFAGGDDSHATARQWLLGDNGASKGVNYGPASRIIADRFGCSRLNGDGMIRRWLAVMGGAHLDLARIISDAFQRVLLNDRFKNVVESRIDEFVRERERGLSLPLGMTAVAGGRS